MERNAANASDDGLLELCEKSGFPIEVMNEFCLVVGATSVDEFLMCFWDERIFIEWEKIPSLKLAHIKRMEKFLAVPFGHGGPYATLDGLYTYYQQRQNHQNHQNHQNQQQEQEQEQEQQEQQEQEHDDDNDSQPKLILLGNNRYECSRCHEKFDREASLNHEGCKSQVLGSDDDNNHVATVICKECFEDPVSIHCPQCNSNFCEKCSSKIHNSTKTFKRHTPASTKHGNNNNSATIAATVSAYTFMPPFTNLDSTGGRSYDFTLVSFNVLANSLVKYFNKPGQPNTHVFEWQYRFNLIKDGITRCMPDVLCLQEVDSDENAKRSSNHKQEILKFVEAIGYGGIYCKKKDAENNEYTVDIGNMLLYRKDVFDVIECENLYYGPSISRHRAVKTQAQYDYYSNRNTQNAIICELRHKRTQKSVVIVNTHITSNYKEEHKQLIQIACVLNKMKNKNANNSASTTRLGKPQTFQSLNFILCGDFNSDPSSMVYRLLSKGFIERDHPVSKPEVSNVPSILPHFLNVRSNTGNYHYADADFPILSDVYKTINGSSPSFTNINVGWSAEEIANGKRDFCDCLDYIFATPSLSPVALMAIPERKNVSMTDSNGKDWGLPSKLNPSDHVPIGCAFKFISGCQS